MDDRFCDSSKPDSVQACQQQECAAWQVGPWGQVRTTISFIAANKILIWCMSCLGMSGITLSIFDAYASEMEIQAHCDECNVIFKSAVVAGKYCKQIITAAVWAESDHKVRE